MRAIARILRSVATPGGIFRLFAVAGLLGIASIAFLNLGMSLGLVSESIEIQSGLVSSDSGGDMTKQVKLFTILPKDGIPALYNPRFLDGDRAQYQMQDPTEPVIALEINGDARAYPVNLLSVHEIVNDVVGGVPVAVTWCPLCYTGIVYAREINGQVFDFGVSGKLLMNNLVMYDQQTDSLWSQFLGRAIKGPLTGTPLKTLGYVQTDWGTWSRLHPDTKVLDKQGRYAGDFYQFYYDNDNSGILGRTHKDNRLDKKEFVLGALAGVTGKAYPFRVLNDEPVINDTLDGKRLLVVFDPESATGVVFSRQVEGQELHFRLSANSSPDQLILVDDETGTRWQGLEGKALEGPLKGAQLEHISFTNSFWFAWQDFLPETELYLGAT